jgi:hypothetical protein
MKDAAGHDHRFGQRPTSGSSIHHEETKSTKIFSRYSSLLRGENVSLNSRPMAETMLNADTDIAGRR